MLFEVAWITLSMVLAYLIVSQGYRKKSLSKDGAFGAFVLGTLSFMSSIKFGVILIVFFVSSSLLTKLGATKKKKLEDDFKEGGQRDLIQVISNSFSGLAVVLIWLFFYFLSENIYTNTSSLAMVLTTAYLCHYSCCCGDTWASELGTLSKEKPFLILNPFKRVPPGTNGGVSFLGCLASLAGGAFIGLFAGLVDFISFLCTDGVLGSSIINHIASTIIFWTIFCGIFGLIGSLIDSVLGALFQASIFDLKIQKVLSDGSAHLLHGMQPMTVDEEDDDDRYEWITGLAVLDNHQINLISSLTTSILGGIVYYALYA